MASKSILNHLGTVFSGNFGEFPCGTLRWYNYTRFFRQALRTSLCPVRGPLPQWAARSQSRPQLAALASNGYHVSHFSEPAFDQWSASANLQFAMFLPPSVTTW